MTISEKVAYLKGMMEGMELDTDKGNGKLLAKIVEILDDMALEIEDLSEETVQLRDYCDELDSDLGDVEEYLLEEAESDSCDECEGCDGCDGYDEDDDEDYDFDDDEDYDEDEDEEPQDEDKKDGDLYVVIVGRNTAGMTVTFATDAGSVIEPEFTAKPHDEDGTLVVVMEELDA